MKFWRLCSCLIRTIPDGVREPVPGATAKLHSRTEVDCNYGFKPLYRLWFADKVAFAEMKVAAPT